MSAKHSCKKTGNLILSRFTDEKIVCYEIGKDGKTDYSACIKAVIKIVDIRKNKRKGGYELSARLLLNAPELNFVRYELLSEDQKEIVDNTIRDEKNNLEVRV